MFRRRAHTQRRSGVRGPRSPEICCLELKMRSVGVWDSPPPATRGWSEAGREGGSWFKKGWGRGSLGKRRGGVKEGGFW